MNSKINNRLDFCSDNVKLANGTVVLPFRGLIASSQCGLYINRSKGVILELMVGEIMTYEIGSLGLKVIVAVIGGSINSPAICGEYSRKVFTFPSGGQNNGLEQNGLLLAFLFNPKWRGVMSIDNIKSENTKENQEAIILLDKFNSAELYEIKKICNSHNLSVMTVIYHFKQHDVGIYKEIIKYITSQKKPPVVVIDSNTALFPQCIMSCSVLGTLEEMQLAVIHTYSKDYEKDELILDKRPMFDLLTEATYQLRAVEAMCAEKEKREAKGGKWL